MFNRILQVCPALLLVFLFFSCEPIEDKEARVATKYCSGCHLMPDPSLLDKNTWKTSVLPRMGVRLGLETAATFEGAYQQDILTVFQTLPKAPMLTESEYELILSYYNRLAPDSLEAKPVDINNSIGLFEPVKLTHPDMVPALSMVAFDPTEKKIYAGSRLKKVFKFTPAGILDSSWNVPSPVADVAFPKNNRLFAFMGIMDPNDQPLGSIGALETDPIADSLKRPVDLLEVQLDEDPESEWVVSNFGNYTGDLRILNKRGTTYDNIKLHSMPGTRMVLPKDVNADGKMDLVVLLTQGDEQIRLFLNQGNLRFTEKILLRFPSVYGSSSFDMADMNNDGKFDLIYTCGDNADYSVVFKPYHGVRIYEQKNPLEFVETYFLPLNGATQVVAHDFDQDKDQDLAVISYFANFNKAPEQGFVFIENKGTQFEPQVFEAGKQGRWLVMEKADVDSDGDMDLLLGALNFTTSVPPELQQRWMEDRMAILYLKNRVKP